jgi:hypothetical protein
MRKIIAILTIIFLMIVSVWLYTQKVGSPDAMSQTPQDQQTVDAEVNLVPDLAEVDKADGLEVPVKLSNTQTGSQVKKSLPYSVEEGMYVYNIEAESDGFASAQSVVTDRGWNTAEWYTFEIDEQLASDFFKIDTVEMGKTDNYIAMTDPYACDSLHYNTQTQVANDL